MSRKIFLVVLTAIATAGLIAPYWTVPAGEAATGSALTLPLKQNSVRFAVIGDNGTGERRQYELAEQMDNYHQKFGFDFVLMLGDNIYGGSTPTDFQRKFELPYKPLLDGGVKFYASLGNHDNPNERFYAPFNMGGKRYYNFKNGNVQFFALDSDYVDPEQLTWIEEALKTASENAWKICFFHHPLYSNGKFHGSDLDLRQRLEPIFLKYGVDVVLSGHDHVYERLKPQNGINYFVMGSSGQLRAGNLRASDATAKGFDSDQTFMIVEVSGDELYFQTVSRAGRTVDTDVITRIKKQAAGFAK